MTRSEAIFADPPCTHWSGEHAPTRVVSRPIWMFGRKRYRWRCLDCNEVLGIAR